jgi:SulP family sulfate permease
VLITASLTSRIPAIIGTSQDSSTIILGVVAAALSTSMVGSTSGQILNTILVAIAVTTVVTGAFCFVVGYFRLGRLVRFIPYPVVGGFLAGTGYLLVTGSIIVMTNIPVTWENLPSLFSTGELVKWLPGVLFAFILYFSLRRFQNILLLPGLLIAFITVTYFALFITGTSIEEAISAGILLGTELGKVVWEPLSIENLVSADWRAISARAVTGHRGRSGGINLLLNVTARAEHQKIST